MDKLVVAIVGFLAIMLGMATFGLFTVMEMKTVQATGCPVDTIIPFLTDAMKSLENGDTQTAQSQLQEAKKELSDSFEVEE